MTKPYKAPAGLIAKGWEYTGRTGEKLTALEAVRNLEEGTNTITAETGSGVKVVEVYQTGPTGDWVCKHPFPYKAAGAV